MGAPSLQQVDLTPGFDAPVADAQACFRAVLDAMARPGSVHAIHGVTAPPPLGNAAAAVLLTLADHATPLWLDPALHTTQAWLVFHTGAAIEPTLDQAAFTVTLALPDLPALQSGTDEIPEAAATVILQVASLASGARFELSGPGLRHPAILTVDGLPTDFAALWMRNHALFPRGIDLILCAGNHLATLPRSTNVRNA